MTATAMSAAALPTTITTAAAVPAAARADIRTGAANATNAAALPAMMRTVAALGAAAVVDKAVAIKAVKAGAGMATRKVIPKRLVRAGRTAVRAAPAGITTTKMTAPRVVGPRANKATAAGSGTRRATARRREKAGATATIECWGILETETQGPSKR